MYRERKKLEDVHETDANDLQYLDESVSRTGSGSTTAVSKGH